MTDFERIKKALFEGGFREDKHFECAEWESGKDIFLQISGMDHDINFEFDNKGNLISIS